MSSHRQRKKIRSITGIVMAVVLALAVFVLSFIISASLGFINTKVLRESCNKYDYIDKVCNKYTKDVEGLVNEYGLPSYISDRIVHDTDLYNSLYFYMERVYKGQEPDKSILYNETALNALIKPYVMINAISKDDAESFLNKYKDICDSDISFDFGVKVVDFKKDYKNTLIYSFIACMLLAIIIIASLYMIFDYKHRMVKYIFYGFSLATIMNFIYVGVLFIMKDSIITKISNNSSKELGTIYFDNSFETVILTAVIMLLLSVTSYVAYKRLRKNV